MTMSAGDSDGWVDVPVRGRRSNEKEYAVHDDDDAGDDVVYTSPSRQKQLQSFRPYVLLLVGLPGEV